MGFKGFFKTLGRGALKVATFVPIPGVPPAIQGRVVQYVKAGVAIAEAKGGKDKTRTAVDSIVAALKKEGVELPEKKIKLLIELVLDSGVGGAFAFDETRATNIAKGLGQDQIERIAALIEEASN